jgi:hypothetical protein
MGRRARKRFALNADMAVTVLGVVGFLGFLVAARMESANSSPYDYMAYAWFFAFGVIKFCLPWMLSKRDATRRGRARIGAPAPIEIIDAEPRWFRSI